VPPRKQQQLCCSTLPRLVIRQVCSQALLSNCIRAERYSKAVTLIIPGSSVHGTSARLLYDLPAAARPWLPLMIFCLLRTQLSVLSGASNAATHADDAGPGRRAAADAGPRWPGGRRRRAGRPPEGHHRRADGASVMSADMVHAHGKQTAAGSVSSVCWHEFVSLKQGMPGREQGRQGKRYRTDCICHCCPCAGTVDVVHVLSCAIAAAVAQVDFGVRPCRS